LAYTTGIGSQANARIWDKAELTGPDKVSITHKVKNPALITADLAEAGPSHYAILPKRATLHDVALEAAFDKNPIGTGPLKLTRRVPASVMEFERFDDFYHQPKNGLPEDRRVKFKSLDLRQVPEEATRVAAVRAGEADVAPVSLGSKKQVEAGGGRLVFGREGVAFVSFLATCWKKPDAPCNDKRVRQALDYAIDKGLMMDKLYGGPTVAQAKGWASVTPSTIGYSPDLDPFPYDPAKARQLLAAAGYAGGKGFGKLIVNTWLSPSTPLLPESAQLVADFWRRELGLDVEVKVGEAAALKKAWLSQELNGQVLWRDNEARLDASGWARNFYGIPTAANRFHNDPGLFEEVQKAIGVFDPVEQPKALNSLYRRLRDETYELGIGYINIPWAVGPRIATWQPYPLAFYPSNLHGITLKP
jgi:peptide/nickel transport system substrate-binding protein